VNFDGSNVRFQFGIPRGNDDSNGRVGAQGLNGDMSQAQLDTTISGITVSTPDTAFSDPDMQALRQKIF
ncbi:MAG: hypothetical protein Q8M07_00480, partial [Prosthecobacter sp.]|nr:hypothetical protein [Prosthecobacter sp.]